jgi:putative salt-induced outer membrane protein YdiY
MKPSRLMSLSLSLLFALIAAMPAGVWADVLLGTNGERLIGRVIEENAGSVVFDSELGGRLNIRRERVRELQRTTVTTDWLPRPPPPDDRFDWVELKSGEWLKGRIKSMQDEKLEFDSEELDIRVFDWKDIRTVRSPRLHSVRFETKANADGSLVITTNRVEVISNNITNTYSREELLAITPTGARESSKWTAKVIAGMNFRSGNTKEVEYNAHATIERRTPSTRFTLDYLGNFGSINDVETENNQRTQARFDYFLSRRLFVRLPDVEYYRDPLQNLDHRLTLGGGVGYDLVHNRRVEWNVSVGPAWQRNQFDSVPPGESSTRDSLAAVFGTRFDVELTKRIDLILEYRAQLAGRESGDNMHHAVASLEFEIHKRLNLDISFSWDRIGNPKTEANGTTPSADDFRVSTGLGVDF